MYVCSEPKKGHKKLQRKFRGRPLGGSRVFFVRGFPLYFWVNNVPNTNRFGAAKQPNIKEIRGPREGGLFCQAPWKLYHVYGIFSLPICAGRWFVGPRFFEKMGRFGAHLRPGSGPTLFRTVKIDISEEACGNNRRGQKSQIAHLMGQELCFVKPNP